MRILAALVLFAASAWAGPCVEGTPACTEWLPLGGAARSLVYRTYPLGIRNDKITRAFVLIHGAGRDADNYFRTAVAAAFLAGALEDTVVIAPRLASNDGSCYDSLAPNEVSWSCSGNSWRSGGFSVNHPELTSFDFADQLLKRLARKDSFPNLKAIVVAGHSAGGQYVTRYEMSNQVHDKLGIPVSYIVANPSSYAWPEAVRPAGELFRPFSDGMNCTTYDAWPYGLEKRSGYTGKLSDAQLKHQLVSRPVTYLLGEIDVLPLGGFDSSCPAMAQGPTRRARGEAFARFLGEKFDTPQKLVVVHLCGHNARCMFTADETLPLAFPQQ